MLDHEIRNPFGEKLDHSFHPARRTESLLILGHGVTGNKDRPLLIAVAEGLADRGWPCLRFSFSGNGRSGGRFADSTPHKEIRDLQAVLDHLPPKVRVAYLGHSLGAAVGVLTAARDPRLRCLISLAGMTHTAAFAEREFGHLTAGRDCMWEEPEHPLSQAFLNDMREIGDVLAAAAEIRQPWLLVHGSDDDLVPVQDGLDALAAAPGPKRWLEIPGTGHSFDESTYPAVVAAAAAWLLEHLDP